MNKEIKDYGKVFKTLTDQLESYIRTHNIKSLVLGVSGGIDSTVVAAVASQVAKTYGIPFYGRSLPIKNKSAELTSAGWTGQAFFDSGYFKEVPLQSVCRSMDELLLEQESVGRTAISTGNIQARLRMIYLYNIASVTGGMVLDTDNLTEHNLGFWTLHGDEGDYNLLAGLWKTEVYELASWLKYNIYDHSKDAVMALQLAIDITPTDGLGISNSDLEQIGASSYAEVDHILKNCITSEYAHKLNYSQETHDKVMSRHFGSAHKRVQRPIPVSRDIIFKDQK